MDRVTLLRAAMDRAVHHIRAQNYGKAATVLSEALVDDAEQHHSEIVSRMNASKQRALVCGDTT